MAGTDAAILVACAGLAWLGILTVAWWVRS